LIRLPNLFDQIELTNEEIGMFLLAFQTLQQQVARDIIAYALAKARPPADRLRLFFRSRPGIWWSGKTCAPGRGAARMCS
jgi:hypothetical protein